MKILVTGADGLTGSAICRLKTDHHIIPATRKDADLTDHRQVEYLFYTIKPDVVIHCAAKVGGIGGNLSGPGDYFRQNSLLNNNIIHYCKEVKVKKLLAFSSVCVFPDGIPILKEELMIKGEPYAANAAYGWSKRMIDVQIKAYKSQFGIKNYCSIIPCNIFGERDLYNTGHGHVLPSLIHKLYIAKKNDSPLCVWGDGSPTREFLYAEDLAKILMKIIDLPEIPDRIIVSNNQQYSIREVVEKLCIAAKFYGDIVWQTDKPNGQMARPTDLTVLKSLIGDFEYTDMDLAISKAYHWFSSNYPNVRL